MIKDIPAFADKDSDIEYIFNATKGQTLRKVGAQSFRSKSIKTWDKIAGLHSQYLYNRPLPDLSRKGFLYCYMKETNEKKTFFILILALLVLLTLTGLAYKFRQEINLPQRLRDVKGLLFDSNQILVRFNIIAGVNDQSLIVKFSMPCKSLTQKYRLTERLPVIKHEMLVAFSQPEVKKSIEQRDIQEIKKHSLQIINNNSEKTIDKIYVEFFSLN